MKVASRVKLCLPDPPTPTSKALPRGVRMMREICIHTIQYLVYNNTCFMLKHMSDQLLCRS